MDYSNLLGNQVTVTNPSLGSSWTGKAVAIAEHPVILIETDQGQRLMLPLVWSELNSEELCNEDAYIQGTFYMCDEYGDHEMHSDKSANVSWGTK